MFLKIKINDNGSVWRKRLKTKPEATKVVIRKRMDYRFSSITTAFEHIPRLTA